MEISLIGSNGFLSSEFGKYFSQRGDILNVYGNKEPELYKCTSFSSIDLSTDLIFVEKLLKSDLVIYACGAGIQSNIIVPKSEIYHLNTFVPITICNKLKELNFKGTFVSFGSYFEIGDNQKKTTFNETEVVNSDLSVPNDYCISKRLFSKFVNSYSPDFNHLHLILPTIYGENENIKRLIPYSISCVLGKEKPLFTSGHQIRQYLYVGDIPLLLCNLLNLRFSGILNVSGKTILSVRDVVKIVFDHFETPLDNSIFGNASKSDESMQFLALNTFKLEHLIPDFIFTEIKNVIANYEFK